MALVGTLAVLIFACSQGEPPLTPGFDGGGVDGGEPDAATAPDARAGCECLPGQACRDGACLDDCASADAIPCATGTVCSDLTGRCVVPGDACTPFGDFATCGTREFAPECGPGTMCDVDHCVPTEDCRAVACDAIGRCRGIECAGAFGTGDIFGVELSPITPAAAGTEDGVDVRGTVSGRDICGLTATIEVRIETALYTTAGDDGVILSVDPNTFERTNLVAGVRNIGGLTADASGALFALHSDTCVLDRVAADGTLETIVAVPGDPWQCSRLTVGPDGGLYVAVGQDVYRVDPFTSAMTSYGTLGAAMHVGHEDEPFITGLAFGPRGHLYVADYWPDILEIAPGGGAGTPFALAPRRATFALEDNPWNEGLAFGPDGLLHAAVFPLFPDGGFVYRVEADKSTTVLFDHASLVDPTNGLEGAEHAGIHAVAFGLDGTLYFTNQNSDVWLDGEGNPVDPFGQLAARRPDGSFELLTSGIDFDYYIGYDGDLVVATRLVDSAVVPIGMDGTVRASFDVPAEAGSYGVRILVTDPTTGVVFTDATGARAP